MNELSRSYSMIFRLLFGEKLSMYVTPVQLFIFFI